MQHLQLPNPQYTPNFISGWNIEDSQLCDQLVDFFETNQAMQIKGKTSSGIDPNSKRSTDIIIKPKMLLEPEFKIFESYMAKLHLCYIDYKKQWPFLEKMPNLEIGKFNLQKYRTGDHFNSVHTERASINTTHRVLAWMTYLNDVEEGGETSFSHFGLSIRPEKGKTLIWPADWSHAHSGHSVTQGLKYIITGWIQFV